ncbi:hypothetical protein [Ancylobacter rudongensis]|uniref:Uncharacterized protein n=1 Tax=Ancylobacter rudongensis TaxID=177413 RepID=A0A1G4TER1_9HYPH|nr:hypothetical protein [Ancylobacter rudongensis]SCW79861.1 hypothetical protein SAMN05660859_2895 [Ancylobacter rudongensis]
MAREDRLVEDLRSIFDEARRSSGQVQAEALLAVAPVVLKSTESERERGVAYMRDRLAPESYRAICRAIGDELDRLNNEIDRLKRFEKIATVVETAKRRIVARPMMVAKPTATAAVKAAASGAAASGSAASAAPAPAVAAPAVGPRPQGGSVPVAAE